MKLSRMTKSSMFSSLESFNSSNNPKRSLTLPRAQRTISILLSLPLPPKLLNQSRAPIEMISSMSLRIPATLELPTSEVTSLNALALLAEISIHQSLHPALVAPSSEVIGLSDLLLLMLIPLLPMRASLPTHPSLFLTSSTPLPLLSHHSLLLLPNLLTVVLALDVLDVPPKLELLLLSLTLMMKMMRMLLAAPFTKMKLSQKRLELSRRTPTKKSPLMSAR